VSGMMKGLLSAATLFALAALAWMVFLPRLVERELRQLTGFDVDVQVLRANPFTGNVLIRGLTARNPSSYPARDFVELVELKTEVNVFSWMFEDHVTINSLDFDLGKVEIIRLHSGTSNVSACMATLSGPADAPPRRPVRYLIKRLHVRLEQLVVADYTGHNPDVKVYTLNIDHTYTDVTDPRQLLVPAVVKTLYSFGLRHDIAQLLPGDFGKALAGAVGSAAAVAGKTRDFFKGFFDKLDHSSKP
jgi:hypothetical protein